MADTASKRSDSSAADSGKNPPAGRTDDAAKPAPPAGQPQEPVVKQYVCHLDTATNRVLKVEEMDDKGTRKEIPMSYDQSNNSTQTAPAAPQGLFGNLLGQFGPMLGQAAGGALGQQGLGNMLGGLAGQLGQSLPFAANPFGNSAAASPQGLFGNLLGQFGPMLGQVAGGALGQQGLGNMLGGLAGQLGQSLPFAASPFGNSAAASPQGLFGNLLGQFGPMLGQAAGGAFGQQGLGNMLGGLAGQLGQSLPFAASPFGNSAAASPQGLFGNLLGQFGPMLGQVAGGALGQQGLGNMLGGLAGQLGQSLPFAASPFGNSAAASPQGLFGNLLGQFGPMLGQVAGGALGQQGLGNMLGGLAGQLGQSLPFAASPFGNSAAASPQGLFGNLLGQFGPMLGQAAGGAFGQQGLGNMLGGLAGQLGQSLPFAASPFGNSAAASPQGLFGNLLGQFGPMLGQAAGGALGQQGLGNMLGGLAGQLGQSLPFAASPFGNSAAASPQGLFGNLLGQFGPMLGQAAGGALGQQGLGNMLGGLAGQLGQSLPFAASPFGNSAAASPQGLFGNLLGQFGPLLGQAAGGALGQQGLGNMLGGLAGQLGHSLPFAANPFGNAAASPQSLFGNLLGQFGPMLGQAAGGALGQQGLGNMLGGLAGQFGPRFL